MTTKKQDSRQNAKKIAPNWHYESQTGEKHVAGVDEAGRGPLAGPVVAAAVILDAGNIPDGLNDSKKLSEAKRETLFDVIMDCAHVGIGIAEPEEIDRINILHATMSAMQRAVTDLPNPPDTILIDGNRCPAFNIPAQAIVKGDAKSLSIAAASIIAKTVRDRLMKQADARFPGYGHTGHKGYPTKAHKEALVELGASPIHRRSYAPVREVLCRPPH
ncbi:MAG: ribonuclease HII [Robiginitomaculum sp.]|nr:ribonuclease HII [Robiginitomaculum sp.]